MSKRLKKMSSIFTLSKSIISPKQYVRIKVSKKCEQRYTINELTPEQFGLVVWIEDKDKCIKRLERMEQTAGVRINWWDINSTDPTWDSPASNTRNFLKTWGEMLNDNPIKTLYYVNTHG